MKIKKNLVHYAIQAILWFILLSSALSFWNRHVTFETSSIIEKAENIKSLTLAIQDHLINKIGLGINSYINSGREEKLNPFTESLAIKDSIFRNLKAHLQDQNFETDDVVKIEMAVNNYIQAGNNILTSYKNKDTIALTKRILDFEFEDKTLYKDFTNKVFKLESEIESQARSDYGWSITDNAIIQIILILLSVPILLITSRRLRNEVNKNAELIDALDKNNKKYFYNDGLATEINAQSVIEKSINSFKKASQFVEDVSEGNYKNTNELISADEMVLNEKTLMGALLKMSSKLQAAESEEQKRQWVSQGLNQFYEIVRNNQQDLSILTDKTVSFLTKYLQSLQGAIFMVRRKEEKEFLELTGCFAFDRKKWIEKRIEVGDGLIGQAYLEGTPNLLTEIPNGYTSITSGLGESTPTALLIVPFKYNEKIEAIFELSGFVKYEKHQIEFLMKAGEFLASALQTIENNNEMRVLLLQSKEQAEALKAQEEELRQNMEELEATNESIRRKENA